MTKPPLTMKKTVVPPPDAAEEAEATKAVFPPMTARVQQHRMLRHRTGLREPLLRQVQPQRTYILCPKKIQLQKKELNAWCVQLLPHKHPFNKMSCNLIFLVCLQQQLYIYWKEGGGLVIRYLM